MEITFPPSRPRTAPVASAPPPRRKSRRTLAALPDQPGEELANRSEGRIPHRDAHARTYGGSFDPEFVQYALAVIPRLA
ncbi:MAG: hypothetical protein WCK89_15560, partial [bacterium]